VGGRLPDFEHVEALAHMPMDRIVLRALTGMAKFRPALAQIPPGAWSRLSDEYAHDAFQRKIRTLAALSPIALEFPSGCPPAVLNSGSMQLPLSPSLESTT